MSAPGPGTPRRNPWWIPPFLGRVPPAITPEHLRLIGAVALALAFENFDQAMLTQAIKQIATDFGVEEKALGSLLGWVRMGAVPALLLVPYADRVGRRRLFLASVVVVSLATMLSAFAPNIEVFVALQMLGRTFMVTLSATAFVIVSEEVAASQRGWSIGILGAIGGVGVGLSALLFAMIDWLPYGWRAMYAMGAVPLLLLPLLRRRVTETRRFTQHQQTREPTTERWWRPLASLMRAYPWRTLAIALMGGTTAGSAGAAYNFSAFYVQTTHGWAPGQYSVMLLVAGGVGVLGYPVAGRLADTRGRRAVGFAFFASFPVLAGAFYIGPSWLVPLAWIPMIFVLTGATTIIRALATELFPTSFRGTASGWLQLVETLGAAGVFFAVSWLTPEGGSVIPAVRAVTFIAWIAAVTILFLPETGRRELEEIAAEPGAAGGAGAPSPDPTLLRASGGDEGAAGELKRSPPARAPWSTPRPQV